MIALTILTIGCSSGGAVSDKVAVSDRGVVSNRLEVVVRLHIASNNLDLATADMFVTLIRERYTGECWLIVSTMRGVGVAQTSRVACEPR